MRETTTRFVVKSAEQLGLPLLQAFSTHLQAHAGQPSTFELQLNSGSYQGYNISLRDSARPSSLTLRVMGSGSTPPRLRLPLRLEADVVQLEGLVVEQQGASGPATEIRAGSQILMDRMAWLGNRRDDPDLRDPLISLAGAYGAGPQSLRISDCWFLDNRLGNRAPALIEGSTRQPDVFAEFTVVNTVFAGNQVSAQLAPGFVERLVLEDVRYYEPEGGGALLLLSNPTVDVRIQGGALQLVTGADPVRLRQVVGLDRAQFQPIPLTGTRLGGTPLVSGSLLDASSALAAETPLDLASWREAALAGEAPR